MLKKLKKDEELKKAFTWKEEELPLIYAAILDSNYFKRQMLFFVIHLIKKSEDFDNEILIGLLLNFSMIIVLVCNRASGFEPQ